MKLTTRSLRNISFVIMLAAMSLVQQVPASAESCGPWWLQDLCGFNGGYIYWRGCDAGTCLEPFGGQGCYDFCIACAGEGYTCLLPNPE